MREPVRAGVRRGVRAQAQRVAMETITTSPSSRTTGLLSVQGAPAYRNVTDTGARTLIATHRIVDYQPSQAIGVDARRDADKLLTGTRVGRLGDADRRHATGHPGLGEAKGAER
ncbi:MAG: hypothetical protein JO248_13380 [Acidimicrobiia bacterium]|nr:hypothetical protein [Acidimicrobiia bacterium]